MCLYPKLIKNRKYLPNKKNEYCAPVPDDERKEWVAIGCGNCMECIKQKTNEWRVRLSEEIRGNKCKFVTLTFSNENVDDLINVIENIDNMTDYQITNELATIATRRFLERWRKKYKRSVKHWLTTELGEENDRVHLHGLLFTDADDETISNIWRYGNVFIGTFVNERTINYIIKYVSKIDVNNKGYKPKILCSKGIGSKYFDRSDYINNRFRGENTDETYRTRQGTRIAQPIYYRNKIYSEDEREILWMQKLDKGITFVMNEKIDISTEKGETEYNNVLSYYREMNRSMGYGDDETGRSENEYRKKLRYLKHLTRSRKHIDKEKMD